MSGGAFQIAGDLEIADRGLDARNSSLLFPIVDAASSAWILPFASSADPYFTGYAIHNANSLLTVQTDAVVEFLSSDGTVRNTTTISLSPGARIANVAPPGNTGYLRVTSNLPIYVSGAIGTKDRRWLEHIPAQR